MVGFRWRLPDAPLRTSVARASVLGLAGVIATALMAGPSFEAAATYPLKSGAVFTMMMAIAIGAAGAQHPFARFGAANHVTMIRAMLVALVAGLVGDPSTRGAAGVVVYAALLMTALDGLDGLLARRSRMASPFGARFDMETDALLILVLSVLVWQYERAGAWVLAGGLLRYAFGVAGGLVLWLSRPLRPTRRGRVLAVSHMIGLAVALAPVVPRPLGVSIVGLTLTALCWSFAIDVRRLWRARREPSGEAETRFSSRPRPSISD